MSDSEDPNEAASEQPQTVEDINGHRYQLKSPPLGEGGQGRVYRTENAEVLVKLVCENSRIIQDESKHKLYRQRFGRLLELDLAGIQVAAPETLLASPWCGYSMRLVRDMVPIKCLLLPSGQELREDYVASGGLRRRLGILTSLARVLSSLHSIPVGYGDISPENIFISEKIDLYRVWLIDADNMHLSNEQGAGFWTVRYAAPELAKCGHSDCRSDVFGFACLAYIILCQHEAFNRGEASIGPSWSRTATPSLRVSDNIEPWEKADVPWVHDEDDPCDTPGIPWEKVCSPKMQTAFENTLGKGRLNPDERPSMRVWQTVLTQARDALVRCPKCQWDFYLNDETCPVCETGRPAFLKWDIRLWHPELDAGYDDPGLALATEVGEEMLRRHLKHNDGEPASAPAPTPPVGFLVQQLTSSGSSAELMTRHCFTLCEREVDKAEMQVSLVGSQIRLDACSDRFAFRVAYETGFHKMIAGSSDHPLPIKRSTRWWIHTGDLDSPHRVLIPTWFPAANSGGRT